MKLLLENWRKYLAEGSQPIKKLRIFDFDETIAYTDSEVRATSPEGNEIGFPDQEAWDNFIEDMGSVEDAEAAGWSFDFSDYSKVSNPEENEMITKIIADVIAANERNPERELYVITARGPEARRPIRRYLKSLGLNPKAFENVIGLAGASKRDEIERIIQKHADADGNTTIESIHFFDDSDIHLNDVKQLRNDFPEIEDIRIKKVFPGGISNVKQENKMDKYLKDHPYMEPDGLQSEGEGDDCFNRKTFDGKVKCMKQTKGYGQERAQATVAKVLRAKKEIKEADNKD